MNVASQHVAHGSLSPEVIQRYLDENQQLIMAILENQNIGKVQECSLYQQRLQQNLMMLASLADTQVLTSQSNQMAQVPSQQNQNVFMNSSTQHPTLQTQPHPTTHSQNAPVRQVTNRQAAPRNIQQMSYPQGIQVVNGNYAQNTQPLPQQPFVQTPVNINPALVKQRSQTQPLPQQPHPMQQAHQIQQPHLQQSQQFQQHPQAFVQNQPVNINNLKTAVGRSNNPPMMLKQPSQTLQQAPIIQQTPALPQPSLNQMPGQQTTPIQVPRQPVMIGSQQPKTQDFYRQQDMLRNFVASNQANQQLQQQQLQQQQMQHMQSQMSQPMSQPMSPQGTPQMAFQSAQWNSLPQQQQQQLLQAQNQRVSKQQLQQLQLQQFQQHQQQQKLQQQMQARLNQAQQQSQAAQPPQPQPPMQQNFPFQTMPSSQPQKAAQQLHSVLPADFMVNFQNSGLAESLIQQGTPDTHATQPQPPALNAFDTHGVGMTSNSQASVQPSKQEQMQSFMPENSFGISSLGMEDELGFSLDANPQIFDTSNTINTDDYLL